MNVTKENGPLISHQATGDDTGRHHRRRRIM